MWCSKLPEDARRILVRAAPSCFACPSRRSCESEGARNRAGQGSEGELCEYACCML